MRVHSRPTLAATALGVLVTSGLSLGPRLAFGQIAQPAPVRSNVDLITIDAAVVAENGTPVRGLSGGDFDVTVDGKPRRVAAWHLLDLGAPRASGTAREAAPRDATFSSNERSSSATSSWRTVVMAIDRASFLPGRGRQTLDAAKRFLARLAPTDRVAVAVYPDPTTVMLPTTDRGAVARAIDQVSGSAAPLAVRGIGVPLSIAEAVDVAAGSSIALTPVFARECSGFGDTTAREACRTNVVSAGEATVRLLQAQAIRSLAGLSSVLGELQDLEGRMHVVLVSAGLFQSDGSGDRQFRDELRTVARQADGARATIQVLHVDSAVTDAFGPGRMSETVSRDTALMTQGLDTLATMNGGALFRITAGADAAFDRVEREMASTYELAIETAPTDRDGKAHAVEVTVARRGTIVRHRQQFTLNAIATAGTVEQQLVAAARSGRLLRDLPMRLSTATFRDPAIGTLRVLVRADIGNGVRAAADIPLAMAIIDASGRLAASTSGTKRLDPAEGSGGGWSYLETLNLREGEDTLRLAAADPDGQIGSVTRRFVARLAKGSGASLSDLLLVDANHTSRSQPMPSLDGLVRGRTLAVVVEAYPDAEAHAIDVAFVVAGETAGPALLSTAGAMTAHLQERRVAATAEFDLTRLPPGDYIATATALIRGNVLGRVSRAFTVAGPSGDRAGSISDATIPRVRFVPGDAGPLGRPFARADVLRPDTLAYFLTRLRNTDTRDASPQVAAALIFLSRGEFDKVLPSLANADAAQLSVTFLKGLALFARGDLEAAAEQFRASADISSGFLPAAFYLGACYAAGGRDEQAVGAWQTSLVSETDARIIYDVLTDALLRLEDGNETIAVINEAREKWPDDDTFVPRLAVAQSMTGEAASAIATLEPYLARHPEDTDAIVLTLRILYDAHAAGRAVRGGPDDMALATRLAQLYRAAGGKNAALMDRWVAFIKQPLKPPQ